MTAPYFKKQLSSRELEVLRFSAQGMTDKEIAQKLDVSLGTVHTYWTRIRAKCQGKTRAEIVGKHVRSTIMEDVSANGLGSLNSDVSRLMAALPHAFFRFDADLTCLFANESGLRLYGKTLDQMMGRNLTDVGLPPRVVHRVQSIADQLQKSNEHTILTVDGYQMDAIPMLSSAGELDSFLLVYVQLSIDPELVQKSLTLR